MNVPRPTAMPAVLSRAAVCGVLLLVAGQARGGQIAMVIGDGWASVRDTRILNIKAGEQTLILDGVPAEANIASLLVRSRHLPLELLQWNRVPVARAAGGADPGLAPDGSGVRWTRPWASGGSASPPDVASDRVTCVVRSSSAWEGIEVDLIYTVRDIRWSARYQVSVRGEQAEEKEPVSVDLSGLVRIENGCSRAFSNAVIRLVGTQEASSPDVRSDPGFLMLDEDSALADLWRERVPARQTGFMYAIPQAVTLPARRSTDVPLVKTVRTPASRLYLMKAEDFPPGDGGADRPLRKLIVFQNSRANRMGMPLPPGAAQIYLGSMRSKMLQAAWFGHTPADGEIRIDLGIAEDVRGFRHTRARSTPVAGAFDETIALVIRNGSESDVLVEIDEKPPVTLEWEVLSSTLDCTESSRRLKFSTDIRARQEKVVEYKVKVRQPQL